MNKQFVSYAGHSAAISLITLSFGLMYLHIIYQIEILTKHIFSTVAITFLVMLLSEIIQRYRHESLSIKKNNTKTNLHLLKSSLCRFIALFIPFYLSYFIVNHYYFPSHEYFKSTIEVFNYLLWIFILLGPIYIYLTLKFKGLRKYEYNDYALLTIIGFKSLMKNIILRKNYDKFYANRRVKKIATLYMVILFFLTLMISFYTEEFHGFKDAFEMLISSEYSSLMYAKKAETWYLLFYHLLFIVDVGIAIIGYSFSSRWLHNRTQNVDMSIFGWSAALICYPPFNEFVYKYILPIDAFDTHQIVTSDIGVTISYILIVMLFSIYVWATMALGFKMGNLTHRGIVTNGPYAYVRHPAYSAKNVAWLIEYSFIYSNLWATLSILAWNMVYLFRAHAEERLLSKDHKYIQYQSTVSYRFLPKLI